MSRLLESNVRAIEVSYAWEYQNIKEFAKRVRLKTDSEISNIKSRIEMLMVLVNEISTQQKGVR